MAVCDGKVANDGALLTFKDFVITDDVTSDMLFVPVAMYGTEDDLLLTLCTELELQI